jgi:hypothetical protein
MKCGGSSKFVNALSIGLVKKFEQRTKRPESAWGQGRLRPTSGWHSRSTPSSGNKPSVPELTFRAIIRSSGLWGSIYPDGNGSLAPSIKQLLAIEIIYCQEYTLEVIPPDERWNIRHRLPNRCGCLPKNCQPIIFGQCRPIVAFYTALQKR